MSPFPALDAPLAAGALAPATGTVAWSRRETHDTWSFGLTGAAEAYAPGQFAMLYAWGAGEAPISVSGGLEDGREVVHTVRAVGAVTEALCRLQPGDEVGVRGPFGTAWPLDAAEGRDVVIVAGGIGLAPVRPVVHRVLAQRERFGRLVLLCGARSPGDLLYGDELAGWGEAPEVQVGVTVDTADAGWDGRVGLVTSLLPRARFDPGRTTALLCGPEVMMRFVAAGLLDRGVAPADIHVSMERSMKCGVGHCGHCQLGPLFICKDGPVLPLPRVDALMAVPEL